METYNKDFYNSYRTASHNSGSLYLAPIIELLKPKSLLDVGCGVRTWFLSPPSFAFEKQRFDPALTEFP